MDIIYEYRGSHIPNLSEQDLSFNGMVRGLNQRFMARVILKRIVFRLLIYSHIAEKAVRGSKKFYIGNIDGFVKT
jgi:hypothetical protein